jgi:S-adenosylmethionine-diacylglycerol 3-amino-3-carboxypropyl transferase
MSKKLTEKVSFDLIRYANCWEDADILLKGLNPKPNSKILSIASAGDNSFSLLTANPEIVVAVDVNKIQLHLVELKKIAIQQLTYHDLLSFLGFRTSEKREKIFNEIKTYLSPEAREYWEQNIEQIKKGIVSQGKFERYFQLFSKKILPWIHSSKKVEDLMKNKSASEQKLFYEKKWNTWRWRLLFKLFFSKHVMGKYGRDPEFLKEVKIPVGKFIFNKAEQHLQNTQAQNNFMLRYNLSGSFGEMLPHYLQPENYEKIKINLDKLVIKEGYAEDAIKEFGKFHCMNLSNIFEYMNPDLFTQTAQQLLDGTEENGRLAYWNLMVPRRIAEILPENAAYLKDISLEMSSIDKGFFYSRFIIDQKIG